ncbi:hypothetical protein BDZ97DRAFT_976586 [Flammula alnicola]|nr:hypothetical protein BDZ97DRAFT_976586 [Flammula alnicola]
METIQDSIFDSSEACIGVHLAFRGEVRSAGICGEGWDARWCWYFRSGLCGILIMKYGNWHGCKVR